MPMSDVKTDLEAGSYPNSGAVPVVRTGMQIRENSPLWRNFKRIFYVTVQGRALPELGMGRSHEGDGAGDSFSVEVKTTSESDLNNLIDDLRDALLEMTPTPSRTYVNYIVGDAQYDQIPAKYRATVPVTGNRMGKVFRS